MKLMSEMKSKSALLTVALAAGIMTNGAIAAGPTLKSSDISQAGQWYGRAGGLVGADRIGHLESSNASSTEVAVSYDKDVAARTNMASDRAAEGSVAISYDKDVAERTNMPRGAERQPPMQADAARQ